MRISNPFGPHGGRLLALALLSAAPVSTAAAARSVAGDEMFSEQQVIAGITISRDECAVLEAGRTAVWVATRSGGTCLRYYAAGLNPGPNHMVAAWLHGDVMNHAKGVRHQNISVRYMIDHMRELSDRYHVPFVFLARPGAYGSAGDNYTLMHTPFEPDVIGAELDSLKRTYHINSWALGGHSGGGTLVAELLSRRDDIGCAIIESGATAYRALLIKHGFWQRLKTRHVFDPYDSISRIPANPTRQILIIGDPRDDNVLFETQQLYYDGLKRHGITARIMPLRKGMPPEHHDLMDFGEAATGLCAAGKTQPEIAATLRAMPEQKDRPTN